MKEFANTARCGMRSRDIRNIPEFRRHLIMNDLTFEEWEQRNKSAAPDTTTEALKLQLKLLKVKFK